MFDLTINLLVNIMIKGIINQDNLQDKFKLRNIW